MKKLEALDVKTNWSEKFEEVDYATFRGYLDEYCEEFGYEANYFMGFSSYYDFKLNSGKYERSTFDYAYECMIARAHYGYDEVKYYLRKER